MATRNTVQRQIILNTVFDIKNHPTAEEVYAKIYESHPTISRGTVYRNLNVLANLGQLLKVSMPDSADRYDHNVFKHYHVKCTDCGIVCDVDFEYIENINDIIEEKTGFRIQNHEIVFKGTCPNCLGH